MESCLYCSSIMKQKRINDAASTTRLLAVTWLLPLIVVIEPKVGNQIFSTHPAERVLQFHELNKEIVFRIQAGRGHWRLEVERKPLLDAPHARAPGQVQQQRQILDDRGCEDRVAAHEVHFDLHRIAKPSEDVDVVPSLFGI